MAWFDLFAKEKGVDKLRGYEPYNEPCTRTDANSPSTQLWYSKQGGPRADRKAADWAMVHHRLIATPLMEKYPDLTVCGAAFSDPSSSYGVAELTRFIKGYEGWPWKDNNTKSMTALSIHSYGFRGVKINGMPAAPDGGQSSINSYFYPTYDNPGRKSGYKAGVDKTREALDENGGEKVKIANTEWWAAAKDIVGKFLNNYKGLVRVQSTSPMGPPGNADNPIGSIQACAD